MVVLLGKDLDKVFRDVCCYLDRRALDECPVIGKDLISYPDYLVGFLDRIPVIELEFLSEIKEKDIRVCLNVFIRISDYNALGIIFECEKVGVALPCPDLILFLKERRIRIHREILVKL